MVNVGRREGYVNCIAGRKRLQAGLNTYKCRKQQFKHIKALIM